MGKRGRTVTTKESLLQRKERETVKPAYETLVKFKSGEEKNIKRPN